MNFPFWWRTAAIFLAILKILVVHSALAYSSCNSVTFTQTCADSDCNSTQSQIRNIADTSLFDLLLDYKEANLQVSSLEVTVPNFCSDFDTKSGKCKEQLQNKSFTIGDLTDNTNNLSSKDGVPTNKLIFWNGWYYSNISGTSFLQNGYYFSSLGVSRVCTTGDCGDGSQIQYITGYDIGKTLLRINPWLVFPCENDPTQSCLPRTSAYEYMKVSINDDPSVTNISPGTGRAGDKVKVHIGVTTHVPRTCTQNQIFKYTITPNYAWVDGQALIDSAPYAQDGNTNPLVAYIRTHATANAWTDADLVSATVQDSMLFSKTNYVSRKTTVYPKVESLIGAAWDNTKSVTETIYPNQISSTTSTLARLTPVDPANRRPRVNDTVAYILTAKDDFGNPVYDKTIKVYLASIKNRDSLVLSTLKNGVADSHLGYITGTTAPDGTFSFFVSADKSLGYDDSFKIEQPSWDGTYTNTGDGPIVTVSDGTYVTIFNPNISDFSISCSNKGLKLTAKCVSDNQSGCVPETTASSLTFLGGDGKPQTCNRSKTFSNEVENGSTGTLCAWDYAGNRTMYTYAMENIDQKAPAIEVYSLDNDTVLEGNPAGLRTYANDKANFQLQITDPDSPAGCIWKVSVTANVQGSDGSINTLTGKVDPNTGIFSTSANYSKKWAAMISGVVSDGAGNTQTFSKTVSVVPNAPDAITSSLVPLFTDSGKKFAGSTYPYKLTLSDRFGNFISDKTVLSLEYAGSKKIGTNMSNPNNPTGEDAISISQLSKLDASGQGNVSIDSIAPGVFNEKITAKVRGWDLNNVDNSYVLSVSVGPGTENAFKKPFYGTYTLSSPAELAINKHAVTNLSIASNAGFTPESVGGNLEDFSSSSAVWQLTSAISGQSIGHLSIGNLASSSIGAEFDLEATSAGSYATAPGVLFTNHPIYRYSLWGKTVAMQLSDDDAAIAHTPPFHIGSTNGATTNLKIVGSSQGNGKFEMLGYTGNFSDISTSSTRTAIKKRAEELIRWRKSSDTPINGVLYKDCDGGDMSIGGDAAYETLVTKNCNVVITSNLNPSGKKFGLIVLRGETSSESIGNIYVQPQVTNINGLIYSDGGFISTGYDSGKDRISNYTTGLSRENTLINQMVLVGSLFTRNTIGWSILWSEWKYRLPWGILIDSSTQNYAKAVAYDLEFFRLGNNNPSGKDKGYNKPFVIIYDSSLASNPPKGFDSAR